MLCNFQIGDFVSGTSSRRGVSRGRFTSCRRGWGFHGFTLLRRKDRRRKISQLFNSSFFCRNVKFDKVFYLRIAIRTLASNSTCCLPLTKAFLVLVRDIKGKCEKCMALHSTMLNLFNNVPCESNDHMELQYQWCRRLLKARILDKSSKYFFRWTCCLLLQFSN